MADAMVAHRIADAVILRLIGKWRAGVMQDGVVIRTEAGTPQGGPLPTPGQRVSALCARPLVREESATVGLGQAYLIRFADDLWQVSNTSGTRRVTTDICAVRAIQPELADDKTRLLLFGRFAAERKAAYSEETGDVRLSGLHACMRNGPPWHFRSGSSPEPKSCRKFLARTKEWLAGHRHWKRRDQQRHLTMLLRGFYQHFGVHHCKPRLDAIRREVQLQWIRVLAQTQPAPPATCWCYLTSRSWFELPYAETRHATV